MDKFLPTIGEKCQRKIDEVWYSATVINVSKDGESFSIKYDDDHKTENFWCTFLEDIRFSNPDPSSSSSSSSLQVKSVFQKEFPVNNVPDSVFVNNYDTTNLDLMTGDVKTKLNQFLPVTYQGQGQDHSHGLQRNINHEKNDLDVYRDPIYEPSNDSGVEGKHEYYSNFKPSANLETEKEASDNTLTDQTTYESENFDEGNVLHYPIESTCFVCGRVTFFRCSVCLSQFYCSKRCQRKNWSTHKRACNKISSNSSVSSNPMSSMKQQQQQQQQQPVMNQQNHHHHYETTFDNNSYPMTSKLSSSSIVGLNTDPDGFSLSSTLDSIRDTNGHLYAYGQDRSSTTVVGASTNEVHFKNNLLASSSSAINFDQPNHSGQYDRFPSSWIHNNGKLSPEIETRDRSNSNDSVQAQPDYFNQEDELYDDNDLPKSWEEETNNDLEKSTNIYEGQKQSITKVTYDDDDEEDEELAQINSHLDPATNTMRTRRRSQQFSNRKPALQVSVDEMYQVMDTISAIADGKSSRHDTSPAHGNLNDSVTQTLAYEDLLPWPDSIPTTNMGVQPSSEPDANDISTVQEFAGVSEAKAREALRLSFGDIESAVNILFNQDSILDPSERETNHHQASYVNHAPFSSTDSLSNSGYFVESSSTSKSKPIGNQFSKAVKSPLDDVD